MRDAEGGERVPVQRSVAAPLWKRDRNKNPFSPDDPPRLTIQESHDLARKTGRFVWRRTADGRVVPQVPPAGSPTKPRDVPGLPVHLYLNRE